MPNTTWDKILEKYRESLVSFYASIDDSTGGYFFKEEELIEMHKSNLDNLEAAVAHASNKQQKEILSGKLRDMKSNPNAHKKDMIKSEHQTLGEVYTSNLFPSMISRVFVFRSESREEVIFDNETSKFTHSELQRIVEDYNSLSLESDGGALILILGFEEYKETYTLVKE